MFRSDAERTAHFVLTSLQERHPQQWLGARAKGVEVSLKRKIKSEGVRDFRELFESFALRSINQDSHQGLLGWLQNRYPLILLSYIPEPQQMLEIQCAGKRYVTLLEGAEWASKKIGRHDGSLEFLLHDLEHAHKFFGNPDCHLGQIRFFTKVRTSLKGGCFDLYIIDKQFRTDFDYLISDMNSHPLHLFKFLKAIVLNASLRKTARRENDLSKYWFDLFSSWGMSQNETLAALTINNPSLETPKTQRTITDFFISSQISALEGRSAYKNDSDFLEFPTQI